MMDMGALCFTSPAESSVCCGRRAWAKSPRLSAALPSSLAASAGDSSATRGGARGGAGAACMRVKAACARLQGGWPRGGATHGGRGPHGRAPVARAHDSRLLRAPAGAAIQGEVGSQARPRRCRAGRARLHPRGRAGDLAQRKVQALKLALVVAHAREEGIPAHLRAAAPGVAAC